MSELSGTRLGKYFVDEKIAVGGMAEVYRAHTSIGEPVAIKVIHPRYAQEGKFIQMFLDEAKIAVGLKHPNIVQVYDFGKLEDSYFLSMEWIDGKPLSAVIRRQQELNFTFPVDVAVIVLIDILKGLDFAHQRKDRFDRPLGIVHRDVSPPNILVTRSGLSKIADFGIADAENKAIKTRPGVIRGKFSYMSPEQSRAEGVDHRSDVFSAGIVLHELLSSRRLFLRDLEVETIEAVRKCDVPPLGKYREDVPESLEKVIRTALAPQKNKRYGSAMEFAEGLWIELQRFQQRNTHKAVAEFMKVLFPWETFVGVDEPLKVLLTRWKEKQRVHIDTAQAPPPPFSISKWMENHPWPVSLSLSFLAIAFAEWMARRT